MHLIKYLFSKIQINIFLPENKIEIELRSRKKLILILENNS